MQKYDIIEQQTIEGRLAYISTDQGKKLRTLLHMLKEWAVDNDMDLPYDCKSGECTCDRICKIMANS